MKRFWKNAVSLFLAAVIMVTLLPVAAGAVSGLEGCLQQLPDDYYGINLWQVLTHDADYYGASGWTTHPSGKVKSVTVPVKAGEKIYASSFEASSVNGSATVNNPNNGIRVTWFAADGKASSISAGDVYKEFCAKGFLTVPQGAAAVCVPMWTDSADWVLTIQAPGIVPTPGTVPVGKVFSVMGDSISTFAGYIPVADGFNREHLARYPQDDLLTDVNETWWMQVVAELDGKLGINDSWRGATVSGAHPVTTGDTGENAAMSNLTRIQNLGSNGTPDVIMLYGGTNDLAHVSKVGAFNAATAPKTVNLTTQKWDNLVEGYCHTLLRMRHYYPNAVILAMLPTYTNGYYADSKLAQANTELAKVCEYYGVPYVDLRECGITKAHLPDNIHPGEEGMDLITAAVVDALKSQCTFEPGENVVYKVTHSLTNVSASLGHYKGISAGNAFTESLTGADLTVTVTMGGVDITESCYANGRIHIPEVTGELTITAKAAFTLGGHLQQLPDAYYGLNLWQLLDHDPQYHGADGWMTHATGQVKSVTFPVKAGEKIYASSLEAAGVNGNSGTNAIRVTWFAADGKANSISADVVYAEFRKNGYLTVPSGAAAVSIPMWTDSADWILTVVAEDTPSPDHSYVNGYCTECQNVTAGQTHYASITDAQGSGVLRLNRDLKENAVISADTYLDLNGHTLTGDITIADGAVLYVFDSATADYTAANRGRILGSITGNLAISFNTPNENYKYLALEESEKVWSFHRYYLTVKSVVLVPCMKGEGYIGTAVDYKTVFKCNDLVARYVTAYGTKLVGDNTVYADYMANGCTLLTGAENTNEQRTWLAGTFKTTNTAEENAANALLATKASAYITLSDGTEITSAGISRSLQDMIVYADGLTGLTDMEKLALGTMYNRFKDVLDTWTEVELANIKGYAAGRK